MGVVRGRVVVRGERGRGRRSEGSSVVLMITIIRVYDRYLCSTALSAFPAMLVDIIYCLFLSRVVASTIPLPCGIS